MEILQTAGNRLSHSKVTTLINAPIEQVDIAAWLRNLPDAEYQRCSKAHIAAGTSWTLENELMSINVEMIGTALVIQHYVATEHRPDYCRMLSVSDTITARGRTKVQILWELKVERLSNDSCTYINEIRATATPEFLGFIAEHNIPLAEAAEERQAASDAHNHEETPNYAKSIENKARYGKYGLPF